MPRVISCLDTVGISCDSKINLEYQTKTGEDLSKRLILSATNGEGAWKLLKLLAHGEPDQIVQHYRECSFAELTIQFLP